MNSRRFDASSSAKQHERDVRRQEKKARNKNTYGKQDEDSQAFANQLRTHQLQMRDIIGDGNCLFRSCMLTSILRALISYD
jgi:hypothetical protein